MSEYNTIHFELTQSIQDIPADQYQNLRPFNANQTFTEQHIFCQYSFLLLLEQSSAVNGQSAWNVMHLAVYSDSSKQNLLAFMPGYIKHDSSGEYIFDHVWHHTAFRYQIDYFPKWVSAIPMTPCETNKLMFNPQLVPAAHNILELQNLIMQEIEKLTQANSFHLLFIPHHQTAQIQAKQWAIRTNVQYRWHNENYAHFDDYLATLKSRHRKKIKKERLSISQSNLAIKWFTHDQIQPIHMEQMFMLYQITHMRRAMVGYLPKEFFQMLPQTFSQHLSLCLVYQADKVIAGALFFNSDDCLFGRYWGAVDYIDNLHFEICYYQGIERCIQKNIPLFDPGVQGEHKLTRGFLPTVHFSAHHIKNEGLQEAIGNFCQEEQEYYLDYTKHAETKLPFSSLTDVATRSAKNTEALTKLLTIKKLNR